MSHLNKVAIWKKADGSVSVTHFDDRDKREGETDDAFITRYTDRLKLDPELGAATLSVIPATDVPTDRANRGKWRLQGGKVKVDNTVVLHEEAMNSKKVALKGKLKGQGFTDEEVDLMVK